MSPIYPTLLPDGDVHYVLLSGFPELFSFLSRVYMLSVFVVVAVTLG